VTIALDKSTLSTLLSSISFTHTPVGTPRGVIVLYSCESSTDTATAVTYGGNSLTQVGSTITGTGNVSIWFLGSSIPTGAQTVAVTNSKGADKRTVCVTLTGAADIIEQVNASSTTTEANPSVSLALGGNTCFGCLVFHSGVANVGGITPLTNWDDNDTAGPSSMEYDGGGTVGAIYTYDTIGSTDITAGYTAASASVELLAAAFREDSSGPALPIFHRHYRGLKGL
jgi:hypothetical protein